MRARNKSGRWRILPKIMMSTFVLTLLGGMVGVGPAVAAGENERITNFINMAKNSDSDNDGGFDLSKLKQEDARFLGVFMSNFYVPYTTELGYADSNDAGAEEAKTKMMSLLGSVGISDKGVQLALTEYVFEQSRDSTERELKWFFSDKDPSSVTKDSMVPSTQTKNSMYNFHKMNSGMYMLGFGAYDKCNDKAARDQINECYKTVYAKVGSDDPYGANSDPDIVINQGKKYAYLATSDKEKIAYSTNLLLDTTTPSMVAFANSSSLVDPAMGFGTSLFDYSSEDIENDALKSDNSYASSIFDIPVGMDGFGNLLALGPNHQYVIMPGAMNPYTWQSVNEDGDDVEGNPTGSVLNLMNFPMLYKSVDGGVVHACNEGVTKCKNHTAPASGLRDAALKTVENDDDYPDDDHANDHKKGNKAPMARILRGSADHDMTSKVKRFWPDTKTDAGEALVSVITDFTNSTRDSDLGGVINWGKGLKEGGKKYNKTTGWMYLPYFGNANYSHKEMEEMKVFSKGAAFDILGEFAGETDEESAENMNETASIIGSDGKIATAGATFAESDSSEFMNKFKESTTSGMLVSVELGEAEMKNLYYTYLMAMDWGDESDAAKKLNGSLGYRISSSNLPDLGTGNFKFSKEALEEMEKNGLNERDEDIRNWTWYLLNPSAGFGYVTSLITNKSTSMLMSTHADIVGATNAPAVAGSTKYLGFSGYVTIPELTDLPWTDAALKWYNSNWMYISLGMIIILGFYALTGVITIQKAIGGAVLFSILAMAPANLVNYTVNTSNRLTNAMYGEKFTYWALLQNQSYAAQIEEAANEEEYTDYLRQQMASNSVLNITGIEGSEGQSAQGQNSVVVKWQAPKKMVTLMSGASDTNRNAAAEETGSELLKQGFGGLRDAYSGEAFLDSDSVYMYRSYIDLSNFSRFIYRGFAEGKQKTTATVDTSKWPEGLRAAWDNKNAFSASVADGYNVKNDGSESVTTSSRIQKPLSSDIVADTFDQAEGIETMTQNDYLGIDTRAFNFSIKPFNDGSSLMEGIEKTTEGLSTTSSKAQASDGTSYGTFDAKMGQEYTNEDYAGLAAYGVMSESPFYYFSWNMYDQGLSTQVGVTENYKTLLLGDDGRSYFYNVEGNDEMRDFLDMKSMFTYTIPYMKAGNNIVRQFDQVYGLKYEEGVPTMEGYGDNPEIKNNPEMAQKYWKNLNISRLYSIYSPWVDLMYGASYSSPEQVDFQGGQITIDDPIDPSTYPAERPMVFSKSEQADWGLKDNQLTQVERKIQEVSSNSQKKMYGLLNAYNYDDNVLVTAASMNTTFEFNKVFSEANLFGDNLQMYPQSYELKNFSYDAFLRLILSNSTGDSISGQSATEFYTSIVQKSSMFTAAVLLANDVLSSYVIPAAKVFGVVAVAFTMLLMLIASCIRIEEDLFKNILRAVVYPLLGLLGTFVGMAFVISLFMSSGNTAVTGYDGVSISLGDPVMVLLAMLGINLVVLFCLFKLFQYMIGNVLRYGKSIASSVGAVIKGSGSAVKAISQGKGLQAAQSAAGVSASSMVGSSSNSQMDRGDGKISPSAMDRMNRNRGGVAENGPGDRGTENIRRPQTEDPKPKGYEGGSETGPNGGRLAYVNNPGQSRVNSDSSRDSSDPFLEEGRRRDEEGKKGSRRNFDSDQTDEKPAKKQSGKDTKVAEDETPQSRKKFNFGDFK